MGNITNKFKLHIAEKFLNSFSTDNIWLFVGKPDAWSTPNTPDTFTDTHLTDITNWDEIMSVQRVSDVSFVIPYNEITSTSVFTQYDDNSNIFDSSTVDKFFGVYSDNGTHRVYKCISNNSGTGVYTLPTGEPSDGAVIKMDSNDGYVWKYMYTISTSDWDKYQIVSSAIGNWIPVKKVLVDDDLSQFDKVMKTATDGEIQHVTTVSPLTFANTTNSWFKNKVGHNIVINRESTGDGYGSGFVATIAQHTDANYYINITNGGSGYRKIETIETKDGSNSPVDASSNLRPVLSPIGGHGWDAVSELGGFRVMVYAELSSAMANFITENDYRKVGLLVNPYKQSSTFDYIQTVDSTDTYISGEKYSSSTNARQLVKIVFDETEWNSATTGHIQTAATADTIFTQVDSSGTETDNKARLVEVDGNNQTAYFLVTAGSIDTSVVFQTTTLNYPKMKGVINNASTTLTIKDSSLASVTKESLKKYTGNIIYVDNVQTVTRDGTQKIKLVIEF